MTPIIAEIPKEEIEEFDNLIKEYRKTIRSAKEIVDLAFQNEFYINEIKKSIVSKQIYNLREFAWQEFLKEEVDFNASVMRDLHKKLNTPKEIINSLLDEKIIEEKAEKQLEKIKEICGEYAGRVFPYIYRLSLSNTQSRRSRAGSTFEAIIYKVYECLEYPYDSQSKVGTKVFSELGLGKKVDSVLPGTEYFVKRRNKAIIGTMKTTLRERWQEVAEEINRTNIPVIHLLTADDDISESKAQEMANHNIVVVTYDWVANSPELKNAKNIISFEEYLFEEIPSILSFWSLK